MRFDKLSYQSTRRSAVGFTLVEMLIVIGIIAILIAIIFPVAKSVKESSRQANSISNLHEIQLGLKQYQQDHDGHSPSVLFGYVVHPTNVAVPIPPMQGALGQAESDKTTGTYFPGLYPTYVKDVSVFTDPDNPIDATDPSSDPKSIITNVPYNGLDSAGNITALKQDFYTADGYDLSPAVASAGALSTSQYDVWYETNWTDLAAANASPQYPQLMLPNPLGSAFITATTYHVPSNNNVLVLFEDGSVHTIASGSFLGAQSAPYKLPAN